MTNREKLLEAALKAAKDLIGYYEDEADRGCYDEEDLPEDLRTLEASLADAERKLKRARSWIGKT